MCSLWERSANKMPIYTDNMRQQPEAHALMRKHGKPYKPNTVHYLGSPYEQNIDYTFQEWWTSLLYQ